MSEPVEATFDLASLWDCVLAHAPGAERIGLAIDAHVATLRPLPKAPADVRVLREEVPRGEAAKTRDVVARLQDQWIGLRRSDLVIAIGGGSTSDVVGFAAATLRRGIPWLVVPTTVLAMADAAHGGKTAINHPAGKNLLGAFHMPGAVWMDAAWLETLPERERRAGLAEVYKSACLGDAELRERLRSGSPTSQEAWLDVVTRAAAVKGALVEVDPLDQGVRRTLNLGHTLGHALERVCGNEQLRHGEAIAIGMVGSAWLAEHRGVVRAGHAQQTALELEGLGLPVRMPTDVRTDDLFQALGLDKKRGAGSAHTWIVPTGEVGARVVDDVTDAEIRRVLDAL